MLYPLLWWALLLALWTILSIYIRYNRSNDENYIGSNMIYFVAGIIFNLMHILNPKDNNPFQFIPVAFFFIVYYMAVKIYLSIIEVQRLKAKKLNCDYILASNGNKEPSV